MEVVVELDLFLVGQQEVPHIPVLHLGEGLAAHVSIRTRVAT